MTFPSDFDVGMNLFNYLGCKKQVWATNANGGYGWTDFKRTDGCQFDAYVRHMDGWTGEGGT